MILICFDGSVDAKAAIEQVADLFHGQKASVLTVWQPFIEVLARTGFGLMPGIIDPVKLDDQARKGAQERAEEGARLASELGLLAEPRVTEQGTTIAEAILEQADAVEASAIVVGSRGLTGLKSALLGSVSHAVLQHADRPVVVVPSPEIAAIRARQRSPVS